MDKENKSYFIKQLVMKFFKRIIRYLVIYVLPDIFYVVYNRVKSTKQFPNLIVPTTINEKILWLKLFDRKIWHKFYSDKILAKEIIKEVVGIDHVIPTIHIFKNLYDFQEKIFTFKRPFIIKLNHDAGGGYIIKSDKDITLKVINEVKRRLNHNFYDYTKEYQYKNIKRSIFIEELLLDESSKIPNDYKLHMINGELAFVYCSIDRETKNYRKIYFPEWENRGMYWSPYGYYDKKYIGPEIEKPKNFKTMEAIARKLCKGFCYVRIDFYEIGNKVFVGEITQHQGSGNEVILPKEFDINLGKLIKLKRSPNKMPYPLSL
tara:strand:- start:14723 stop:15679 length:957 start_codon:yes stop_codon:yes gene_type:complete